MLRPRLGLPRELIGAAIFLASDASELVTGHTLMCDDGYLTHERVGHRRIIRVRAATFSTAWRCPSSSARG